MPHPVLDVPPGIVRSDVVSGRAPRARDWRDFGLLLNHILGRGQQVVTPSYIDEEVAPGASITLNFASHARFQPTQRMWFVILGPTSTGLVSGVFTDASGGTHPFTVAGGTASTGLSSGHSIFFRENIASRIRGLVTDTVAVANNAGSLDTLKVWSVGCVDVPRVELEPGAGPAEYGSQVGSLTARAPIYDGTDGDGESVYEIARRLANATAGAFEETGRGSLFHWMVPEAFAASRTATSFASIFTLNPHVLARKMLSGETARDVWWRARARATTQNGEIRLTSTLGGDTGTVTVTAGAGWAWTSASKLLVECERVSGTLDGNQTEDVFEDVECAFRTAVAGGTIEVASLWIGEDD